MRTAPTTTFTGVVGNDFFTTLDDSAYGNYGSPSVRGASEDCVAIRLTWGGGGYTGSSNLYVQNGRRIHISAEL